MWLRLRAGLVGMGRYAEMRGGVGRSQQTMTYLRHLLLEQASLPGLSEEQRREKLSLVVIYPMNA